MNRYGSLCAGVLFAFAGTALATPGIDGQAAGARMLKEARVNGDIKGLAGQPQVVPAISQYVRISGQVQPPMGGGVRGGCSAPATNCHMRDYEDGLNSTTGQYLAADDFVLASNTNVSSLCFWGVYFNGTGQQNFEVNYFQHDGSGQPGALIASFSGANLNVSGAPNGEILLGFYNIYEFTATHAPVALQGGTCYYIQIINNITGDTFFWLTSNEGNQVAIQAPNGAPYGYWPDDLSFCVNGALSSDAGCAPEAPANDDFNAAETLGCNSSTTTDNTFATTDAGDPIYSCAFGGPQQGDGTLWYSFVATSNNAIVDTCGSAADTMVQVLDGSMNELGCNDDATAGPCTGTLQSQVEVSGLTVGNTYYIQVASWPGGARGTINVNLTCPEPTGGCCTSSGCQVLTAGNCASAGGTYLGNGTDCGGVSYTAVSCGNSLEDISGSGTQLAVCDDCGNNVPIGFSFEFFGTSYNTVSVESNGFLSFNGPSGDYTNDPIPSAGAPNNIIAPLWDDFAPNQGGSYQYQTLGAAPNRRFIAQWTGVPQYATGDSNTFQVVLFEGTNDIEFHYGTVTPEGGAGDYTIGIENADGTDGVAIPGNTAGADVCHMIDLQLLSDPCDDCPADFDNSGTLTLADFVAFRNAYVAGDMSADFDNSGTLTLADFVAFRNAYVAGCP